METVPSHQNMGRSAAGGDEREVLRTLCQPDRPRGGAFGRLCPKRRSPAAVPAEEGRT